MLPILIKPHEYVLTAMRSQGAGGQNVNKVSTAIHLRFDINCSSLTDLQKRRLLDQRDARLTSEGVLIIKAQRYRSQDLNRQDAIERLHEWLNASLKVPLMRYATKPTLMSKKRRIESKQRRGQIKAMRGKIAID